jgi:ABC-type transport system involved in multi-copper enzyme maturation permease subunit
MLSRILALALNTYREAVRARILYGLLGAALATSAYSLIVATLSLHQEARVVADVGSASISVYAILVAVVLGATSLYREVELKTIFPILTRRLRRHEYILGKYFGALATLFVFIALDGALVLALLGFEVDESLARQGAAVGFFAGMLGILLWRVKRSRVFMPLPWSLALFIAMAILSEGAGDERRLVLASCALTACEVSIVMAVATFFSSFSSPFLTAVFTLGVFLVGRSSDTLGHLPVRVFGEAIVGTGRILAHVLPNLALFVPARPVLLGQIADMPVWPFVGHAALVATAYTAVLLLLSALIFQKRDFQ